MQKSNVLYRIVFIILATISVFVNLISMAYAQNYEERRPAYIPPQNAPVVVMPLATQPPTAAPATPPAETNPPATNHAPTYYQYYNPNDYPTYYTNPQDNDTDYQIPPDYYNNQQHNDATYDTFYDPLYDY